MIAAAFLLAEVAAEPLDYGAKFTYSDGVAAGEAYVKADLVDPGSAQFEWPNDFVPFTEKVPLFKRTTGFATCFTYNAKNAMGGYVGAREYRIIVRDGKVIDLMPVSDLRWVPNICKELRDKFGMGPAPRPRAKLGISFDVSAAGLLVASVDPGSPAAKAGLAAGQTIVSIGGVPIAGKPTAEVRGLLDAAPDAFSVDLQDQRRLTIDRAIRPTL